MGGFTTCEWCDSLAIRHAWGWKDDRHTSTLHVTPNRFKKTYEGQEFPKNRPWPRRRRLNRSFQTTTIVKNCQNITCCIINFLLFNAVGRTQVKSILACQKYLYLIQFFYKIQNDSPTKTIKTSSSSSSSNVCPGSTSSCCLFECISDSFFTKHQIIIITDSITDKIIDVICRIIRINSTTRRNTNINDANLVTKITSFYGRDCISGCN